MSQQNERVTLMEPTSSTSAGIFAGIKLAPLAAVGIGGLFAAVIHTKATVHERVIALLLGLTLGYLGGAAATEYYELKPAVSTLAMFLCALLGSPIAYALVRIANRVRDNSNQIGDAVTERIEVEVKTRRAPAPKSRKPRVVGGTDTVTVTAEKTTTPDPAS